MLLISRGCFQVVIDMPEHDGSRCGMGGTMRLGKRSTVFLTDQSVLSERLAP